VPLVPLLPLLPLLPIYAEVSQSKLLVAGVTDTGRAEELPVSLTPPTKKITLEFDGVTHTVKKGDPVIEYNN